MATSRASRATAVGLGVAIGSMAGKAFAVAVVPVASAVHAVFLFADDLLLATALAVALRSAAAVVARVVLAAVLGYVALNVVLVRVLGRPLLWTMLPGCDAAMGDCAAPYLSFDSLWPAAVVVAVGLGAPFLGRGRALSARAAAWALAFAIGGCVIAPSPEHGAHRNAWFAFLRSVLPRSLGPGGQLPPAPAAVDEGAPLARFAGCARGRSVVVVVLESAAARFVDDAAPGPSPMPFLAELGAGGLVCDDASAVYPESIEGQVPLFCGVPPIPDGEPSDYARHSQWALPRRLAAHGYTSGLFHAGRFRFLGMEEVLAPFGFDVRADAATIGGELESSFGIDEEATVDALLRWVGSLDREQPFLACWLPIAGHHPYGSPPGGPFPTDTQLGCYRNALHYADRSLRRLWEGLLRMRGEQELLLCVVGDHGQAFGEHPGNFGHSFELYEENLRVPLCFVVPGAGLCARTAAVCSHLDVVPTLLDLLAIPAADTGHGASVLRRPLTGGSVCAFTDWGELLVGARDGCWKLIHEVGPGRDRLFDLVADPHERTDVAAMHADVARRLRDLALSFARAAAAGPGR